MMRRIWRYFLIAIIICTCFSPLLSVSARAGGASGGSGGSGGGNGAAGGGSSYGNNGGTSAYTGRSYGQSRSTNAYTYRRAFYFFGNYGYYSNAWFGDILFVGIFASASVVPYLRRKRIERAQPHNTAPMSVDLEREFTELFYRVETAWADNDQYALRQVFDRGYFIQQKLILDGYTRHNKINRLESIAVVNLLEELTGKPNRIHVAVTAQMRDYFEFFDQDERYNEQVRDDALIERFTEVWEMHRDARGQLLVDTIRQA
jgi:hypothetical protein